MFRRFVMAWVLVLAAAGTSAQSFRSDEMVEVLGNVLDVDASLPRKEHGGSNNVVIYDLATKTTTQRPLAGSDDIASPDYINDPPNDVRFDIPVRPAKLRFALIEINNAGGGGSCSATYIGRRHFLTAGHCVYANGWPTSGRVIPGFENGKAPIGAYALRRVITFTAWVQTGDKAHDVAVIEVDRDLPASVAPVPVRWQPVVCKAGNWQLLGFERHFYEGGAGDQLRFEHTHRGCEEGTIYFFTRTKPGSSGSAPISPQGYAYGVLHGWRGSHGQDAPITRAKECFIREALLGEAC